MEEVERLWLGLNSQKGIVEKHDETISSRASLM